MTKNARTILLCAAGIISVALSVRCFSFKDLDYEQSSMYGGDAYTGIQNAAAMTSKNVKELASIVQFGFGSVLLVSGLTLLAFGLTSPILKTEKEDTAILDAPDTTPALDAPATTATTEEVEKA